LNEKPGLRDLALRFGANVLVGKAGLALPMKNEALFSKYLFKDISFVFRPHLE
jgi:hypothetical protein